MGQLKKYADWIPVLEKVNGVKVIDDDGGRELFREGRSEELMERREAFKYFLNNTIINAPKEKK